MNWAYRDHAGILHAVAWADGDVTGDPRAVALIRAAVASGQRIDSIGTAATLESVEVAFLTIDRVLHYWFDDVLHGPDADTAIEALPDGRVR